MSSSVVAARRLAVVGVAAVALLAAGTPAGRQQQIRDAGQTQREELADHLVVMVQAQFDPTPETIGAGIVFGIGPDSVYIATAGHLVRLGDGREPQSISVLFKADYSGATVANWLPASLMRRSKEGLDLAVLEVAAEHVPQESRRFDWLGDSQGLQENDELFNIGYPFGDYWIRNFNSPHRFLRRENGQLVFQAEQVRNGDSGGGLFNASWELVGMVLETTTGGAVALPIDTILAVLDEWNYPVRLTPPAMTAADELTLFEDERAAKGDDWLREATSWGAYLLRFDGDSRSARETMREGRRAAVLQSDPGRALQLYERAIELDEGAFIAEYYLASLYHIDLDEPELAREHYEKAIAIFPAFAAAHDELAFFFHYTSTDFGRINRAEEHYNRAIEHGAPSAATHHNLANLYHYQQQRRDLAEQHYKAATDLDPADAWAWTHRAILHEEAYRDLASAAVYYQRAIDEGAPGTWAREEAERRLAAIQNRRPLT